LVLSGLLIWVGAALLLSELRWFARRPLAERLRPYVPGGLAAPSRTGLLSVESFREVVAPLSNQIGERVARLFGVSEDLRTRLARVHSPLDPTTFRVRQLGWSIGAFGAGALAAVAFGLTPAVGIIFALGAPLLAFLLLEQQVASASAKWQRRLFLELPVVSEQIGMLLSAGYSLGAALNRTAARSKGVCGRDLTRVSNRIRQGLTEVEALREWAELADVEALARFVQVLALNREAGDLGRLISEEARAIRRDVQRELVEQIERRSQLVWIPVTVATLVPGTLFLAVPFIEAMRLFSGA
ncbi:MAG: type II secretion system F family protein, partial [Actinomycetota bacterium]|nr:type II secretion system F family protein [Actinomycetota bacterium]